MERERVGSRHLGRTIFQAPERAKSRPSWASSNSQYINVLMRGRKMGSGQSSPKTEERRGISRIVDAQQEILPALWEFLEDLQYARHSASSTSMRLSQTLARYKLRTCPCPPTRRSHSWSQNLDIPSARRPFSVHKIVNWDFPKTKSHE